MWGKKKKKVKKKILVIDDERDFAKLVKLNLEDTGNYEVRAETRGPDGIVAAKVFKPDLILLDVLMPLMDGAQVAAKIKDDEETKNIPIVFLTAATTREEADSRGGLIGGYPFIAKPILPAELIIQIEQMLR